MDRPQGESLNLHHFEKVTRTVRDPRSLLTHTSTFAELERWNTPAGDFLFRNLTLGDGFPSYLSWWCNGSLSVTNDSASQVITRSVHRWSNSWTLWTLRTVPSVCRWLWKVVWIWLVRGYVTFLTNISVISENTYFSFFFLH